jgi:hypothetical protein
MAPFSTFFAIRAEHLPDTEDVGYAQKYLLSLEA